MQLKKFRVDKVRNSSNQWKNNNDFNRETYKAISDTSTIQSVSEIERDLMDISNNNEH